MTQALLQLNGVTKDYPEFKLGPVNLAINSGDTCAIVGKNGAGKTTLFQIITGNSDCSDGELYLSGQRLLPDSFQLKRRIGYLPQNLDLPRWVSGQDLLSYASRLYELGNERQVIEKTLAYWDCLEFRSRPLAACSHGMQKRIALALATLHEPEFLVLDEPFSGLDLFHIKALEDIIRKRHDTGRATIICTHVALYAARLCHKLIVVEGGQLSELETWAELDAMQRIAAMERQFFGDRPES